MTALFAACGFSGCNDDESVAPENAIGVSVTAEDLATKGSAVTTASLAQFDVDGFLLKEIAGKETHYINNGVVTKTTNGWSPIYKTGTTDAYAWASPAIAFWAHSPYPEGTVLSTSVTYATDYGTMSFGYTLPAHTSDNADAELQQDIVVAYTKASYADTEAAGYVPGIGKVNFAFGHALAGIRLDVTNLAAGWTVENVTLSGIYSGGSCTVTPAASGAPTFAWTLAAGTATFVQTLAPADFEEVTVGEGEDAVTSTLLKESTGKVFFIPPQTFPEGAKMILTLNDGENSFDVTASLAGLTAVASKMNTYAVTKGFLTVTLTGEVRNWDTTEVPYTTTDVLPQATQFAVSGAGVQNVYDLHHTDAGKPYRQTWVLGENTATVSFRIFSPAGGTYQIVPQGDTGKFTVSGTLTGSISARPSSDDIPSNITKAVFTVTPNGAAANDQIWFKTYVTDTKGTEDTSDDVTYSLDSETQLYDIRGYHYFQINDPLQ